MHSGTHLSINPFIKRALACTRARSVPTFSPCLSHKHAHMHVISTIQFFKATRARGTSPRPIRPTDIHVCPRGSTPSPPRGGSSSATLAQAERIWIGTWQRQGRSVQLNTQKKAQRSQVGPHSSGKDFRAATVYFPHVRPVEPRRRLATRNSSLVRKTIFRLLATSRPPSSGLHL